MLFIGFIMIFASMSGLYALPERVVSLRAGNQLAELTRERRLSPKIIDSTAEGSYYSLLFLRTIAPLIAQVNDRSIASRIGVGLAQLLSHTTRNENDELQQPLRAPTILMLRILLRDLGRISGKNQKKVLLDDLENAQRIIVQLNETLVEPSLPPETVAGLFVGLRKLFSSYTPKLEAKKRRLTLYSAAFVLMFLVGGYAAVRYLQRRWPLILNALRWHTYSLGRATAQGMGPHQGSRFLEFELLRWLIHSWRRGPLATVQAGAINTTAHAAGFVGGNVTALTLVPRLPTLPRWLNLFLTTGDTARANLNNVQKGVAEALRTATTALDEGGAVLDDNSRQAATLLPTRFDREEA